ncbi:MAG: protein kinase [Candidatus Contendobacter sp.]|nr:protein kinase [Candidatus Contendobacter sp.]
MQIPGYQIERELGQGGMAIVYLALQESLHRHVALKVIKPILTTDEEFAQRFMREGRIIAQLSDPHIVTVYDIASYDQTYYLSMEYLPGDTLQQRIRDGLPLSEALIVAKAIAGALHYAHRRGIIHRDIKPQNILFRENGAPVLTDFGIAKTLGSSTIMTRTGLSIGTPRYMSPEQIRGQDVDARADIYSFGVLFYEMLTGNVPYTANDSFALAMMHITAPTPELPPGLGRYQPLLDRLLDKDPDQRFQTGQEFIAALEFLEQNPGADLLQVTGSTRSFPSLPAPPSRRGWKIAVPVAILASAALAGGGYFLFLHQPPPPLGGPPEAVVTTPTPPPPKLPPPTDPAAQARAQAEALLAEARRRQQAGALEESLTPIDQGLGLVPDNPGLLALRQEVLSQIAAAKARNALEEQQIQAQLQAEQFLDQAQRARQEGGFGRSLVHIEQGLQAMPTHHGLLALKQEVLAQQADQQRQETAARRQAEAAERQKLEAEQRQRKAEELLARAQDSQRNRAYETSLLQIEQGLQQVPEQPRLLALRDMVRQQLREAQATPPPEPVVKPPVDESAKLVRLLRECDAHLQANRLASGKGGNAADCYSAVLKQDRGNAQALAGLDRIAERYADSAAMAVQRGNAKNAKSALDRLARLNPNHPRLAELRNRFAQPEPVAKPAASDSETRVIAQDQHTQISKTETDETISLLETTSQQGALREPPPEPSTKPRNAEEAWKAIRNSNDPAEIEQFLTTYSKSRQARAAQAKLKELQKQAPAASGGPAQLMVRSDVEDAEVSINGKRVGTTPIQVEIKAGSYRVRVSREGYTDWNGKVNLAAGDESTLTASLPKKLQIAAVKPPLESESEPESAPPPKPAAPKPPVAEPQTTASRSGQAANCLRGNCENGSGTYRYPDGSEYSGDFRNAKMHGEGTYAYAGRGEKYVGEWRGGVINGQGTYYYRSGNRYQGEWRNGRKSGQGTYTYANGDKYVGDFANDQPNGQGTYTYSSGDRYVGEWRNGRKNGQGVMYENGMKIVGEWQNDQKARVSVEK